MIRQQTRQFIRAASTGFASKEGSFASSADATLDSRFKISERQTFSVLFYAAQILAIVSVVLLAVGYLKAEPAAASARSPRAFCCVLPADGHVGAKRSRAFPSLFRNLDALARHCE
jgi:hypothetical protein